MIKSWSDAAWEDFEYWMKQDRNKKNLEMVYKARFKIFYGNIPCQLKSAVEKLREARYDI